jgi:hypothetical protein
MLKLPPALLRFEIDAFIDCQELVDVSFASLTSLQSIGWQAFDRCSILEVELELPGSLKVIEGFAFCYCSSLIKLFLPSPLLRIEVHASSG